MIIGMDIGHCDDTATIITWSQGKNESKRLQMDQNNNMVISSQITLTFDQMRKIQGKEMTKKLLDSLGDIGIGDRARRNPKDGEYFVYFKCPPEKFDVPYGTTDTAKATGLTRGRLMAIFTYQAFNNLLKYNNELEDKELTEMILMVGCPTTEKWTDDKNLNSYAGMIQQATGVSRVVIIPESRAAMFSSVERSHSRFSASDGVLVFDFGSSTADCTYMLLGRKIAEFSWDMGASMIEEQMMTAGYKQCKALHGRDAKNLLLVSPMTADLLGVLRKTKEEYYQGNDKKAVCTFIDTDGREFDVTLKVNDALMTDITCHTDVECECDSKTVITCSWQSMCKRFYQEAKSRLDQEKLPCRTIILTGGASRMDFIVPLCKEVFSEEVSRGTKIFQDSNPSYSVSNGLGWAGAADERYDKCLMDAKTDMKNGGAGSFSMLEEAVSSQLREQVFKVIKQCSQQWADSVQDCSVNDLQSMIQQRIETGDGKTDISKSLQSAIDIWREGFKKEIQTVVNKQSEKLFSQEVAQGLIISNNVWGNLQATNLDINIDVEKMLKNLSLGGKLNEVLSNVVMYSVAAAVALAFAVLPVLNVILGIIAGVIAGALVSDEDMEKKRSQDERKKINNQMDKVLAQKEIVSQFNNSVSEAMADCKEDADRITEETLRCAFDIITLRRFSV